MIPALLAVMTDEDIEALSTPKPYIFAEVALGGQDGDRAESLLKHAKEIGTAQLASITEQAVKRFLKDNGAWYLVSGAEGGGLFDEDELEALAEQFAALAATAELLGRSRIRLRQAHVARYSEDDPTDFSCFADTSLAPMAPMEALDYFRKLVPTLGVTPEHFGSLMERQGFTMAKAVSEQMLKRVQKVLADQLEQGINVRRAIKDIDRIMDEAGVSRKSPGYSELVVRTSFGESFNAGWQREFSDPDLDEDWPVWRYQGIRDGRQRSGPLPKYADHDRHFGRYFSRDVLFADVRGRDIRDVAQCRCSGVGVFAPRWEKLQAQGAVLTPWPDGS